MGCVLYTCMCGVFFVCGVCIYGLYYMYGTYVCMVSVCCVFVCVMRMYGVYVVYMYACMVDFCGMYLCELCVDVVGLRVCVYGGYPLTSNY